jgi:hypothetical protein
LVFALLYVYCCSESDNFESRLLLLLIFRKCVVKISELLSIGGGSRLMAQFSVISLKCCWLPAFAIPFLGVKELRIHVFRHQCWSVSEPASHNGPDLVHLKATLARQRDSSLYRQARNCLASYKARWK